MAVAAPVTPRYTGLVTRALALAIDALLINVVAAVVGAVIGLCLSLLGTASATESVVGAISGTVYIIWTVTYFVSFWSTTGQTPGAHVLRFRVHVEASGRPPGVARSLLRLLGLVVAAIPLCAGFLPVLFDRRRRALQDMVARTVVTDTEPEEAPVAAAAPPPRRAPAS